MRSQFFNDAVEILNCNNCPKNRFPGHEEWLFLSARDPFVSPYQDGHYIYIVDSRIQNKLLNNFA